MPQNSFGLLLKLASAKVTKSFFVKHLLLWLFQTKWVHNGKPLHIIAHSSKEIILPTSEGGFNTWPLKLQGTGYGEINPEKLIQQGLVVAVPPRPPLPPLPPGSPALPGDPAPPLPF